MNIQRDIWTIRIPTTAANKPDKAHYPSLYLHPNIVPGFSILSLPVIQSPTFFIIVKIANYFAFFDWLTFNTSFNSTPFFSLLWAESHYKIPSSVEAIEPQNQNFV